MLYKPAACMKQDANESFFNLLQTQMCFLDLVLPAPSSSVCVIRIEQLQPLNLAIVPPSVQHHLNFLALNLNKTPDFNSNCLDLKIF